MKILKHPLFIGSVLLALSIYISQRLNAPIPKWISFYVNDFLCMPIVLATCLASVRIIKKSEHLYVPVIAILAITAYFTLFFEWILPKYSDRYYYDPYDIVLYSIGAFLFYKFQRNLF